MKRWRVTRGVVWLFRRVYRLLTPTLDVHFSGDDANHFLPWLVGFMVFLTGLILAAAITLNSAIAKGKTSYSQHITVEVPYSEGMNEYANKIIGVLQKTSGVANPVRVEDKEVKKLVEPWLGKGEVMNVLPLPILIEAELTGDTKEKNEALESRLSALIEEAAPSAKVESEQEWADQFSYFTRTIQMIAYLLAGLIISAAIALIVMSARTGLKLHARTISLLHQVGAKNNYIANQFELNALLLSFKGALLGTCAAIVIFALIGFVARHMDAPLLPSMQLSSAHWIMFLILPLLTALAALISARAAIMLQLSKDALMLVLLDRDGVLNLDRPDSVKSPEELVLIPRAAEALALLARHGCTNVVVSNQSVIGRGIIDEAMLQRIHAKLQGELVAAGGILHDIMYCSDAPGNATYRRKPKPGMLKEALEKYGKEAPRTPMIGDAITDMEAALALGCPRYLVRTGKGNHTVASPRIETVKPFTLCEDVYDAAIKIIEAFRL